MRNIETKSEIDESKKWENKNKRRDLIYKTNKYKYDFEQYETIRSFSDEAEMNQSNLLKNMVEFNEQSKLRKKEDKKKKKKKIEILLKK